MSRCVAVIALIVSGALLLPDAVGNPSPLMVAIESASEESGGRAALQYVYEMDYSAPEVSLTAIIDPSLPEGGRVRVVSPDAGERTEAFGAVVAQIERTAERGYWCRDFAKSVPADARVLAESDTSVTYGFVPQPTGGENDDFMENLTGRVTLDKQTSLITSFSLESPKPFRQKLIAKITSFTMKTECATAPDGQTFAEQFDMNITGSAAFRKFEQKVSRTLKVIGPVAD